MKAIEKILVVVDPGRASHISEQHAVRRGFCLAERTGAELQVLLVCNDEDHLKGHPRSASFEEVRLEYIACKRAWLKEIVSAPGLPSVPVEMEVVWDRYWHRGVTRQVLRYEPDLVLKDTHHHSALARAFFTSTDWHLIRECPAPLMLVRSETPPASEKILAAVDPLNEHDKPADLDRRILDTASLIAQALGGELHVVHVFQPILPPVPGDQTCRPYAFPVDGANERLRSEHWEGLKSLVARQHLATATVELRSGSVAHELIAAARDLPATLVVTGAVARKRIKRLFLGSTAEEVLESMPCDVLIVKPEDFRCPVRLEP